MPKRQPPPSAAPPVFSGEQRINKVLASAGLGSRRQVDELIEQGRVEIDGKTVQQVGVKVDPDSAAITVDGEPLKRHRPVYFALHKPEGVLCTNRDPQGRPRVVDMVPNSARLFPVGRLDAASTGLILLTNDGELAQRLAHPKHGVSKRYAVVVVGQVELDALKRLERGIYLAEGRAKVDNAKLRRVRKGCTELEITLSEGKNREIRRVLARLGHKVVSLKRIAIGPLKLGEMPEGAYRPLGSNEVTALYAAVEILRRARNQERKARKKKLAASTDEAAPTTSKRPAQGRDQDDFESLPSLAKNPYRTEEDFEDPKDPFGDESILVRDYPNPGEEDDWPISTSKRTGAVIADEDDEDIDDDGEMDDESLDASPFGIFDDEAFESDEDLEGDGDEDDYEDDENEGIPPNESDDPGIRRLNRRLGKKPRAASGPNRKSNKVPLRASTQRSGARGGRPASAGSRNSPSGEGPHTKKRSPPSRNRSAEGRSAEGRSAEGRPAEGRPAGGRPVNRGAASSRSATPRPQRSGERGDASAPRDDGPSTRSRSASPRPARQGARPTGAPKKGKRSPTSKGRRGPGGSPGAAQRGPGKRGPGKSGPGKRGPGRTPKGRR
jgi:23S rRNA pseudouridine2605 synthase